MYPINQTINNTTAVQHNIVNRIANTKRQPISNSIVSLLFPSLLNLRFELLDVGSDLGFLFKFAVD